MLQASMPLGVMLGYVVSGYLVSLNPDNEHIWRFSFVIQAVMLAPLVLGLFVSNARNIQKPKDPPPTKQIKAEFNLNNTLDDIDEEREAVVKPAKSPSIESQSFSAQLGVLISSRVFVFSTFGTLVSVG